MATTDTPLSVRPKSVPKAMSANKPNQPAENPRLANTAEAATIRDMIRHEDSLIDARINWLVSSQSILFAALAFVWNNQSAVCLLYLLVFVGLGVSSSTFLGLMDSAKAIRKVRGWWDDHVSEDYYGPDVVGLRGRDTSFRLFKPWKVIPLVFILAWCCVPIANYLRGTPNQPVQSPPTGVTSAAEQPSHQP